MSCMRCAARLLTKFPVSDGVINLPSPLVHSVRGIKPRWLPKSKSKIFYVRKPTPIDPEEYAQMKILYPQHRAHLRSIRSFLCKEHLTELTAARLQSIKQEDKALEFKTMEDEVAEWNARVQTVREDNQVQEADRQNQRVERKVSRREHFKLKRLEKAEQKLQKDLEEAPKFITMENLDTEIEKLLNMRTDYNFAIDKMGNKFSADSAVKKEEKQRSSSSEQTQAVKG